MWIHYMAQDWGDILTSTMMLMRRMIMGWKDKALVLFVDNRMLNKNNLYKMLFLLGLCVGMIFQGTSIAMACPATPKEFPLVQPDGSIVMVRQWGDEWNNGLETLDGYTIIKDQISGYWVYADLIDGELVTTNDVVGKNESVRINNLQKHLRPQPYLHPTVQLEKKVLGIEANSEGNERKTLALLIQFSDRKPSTTPAQLSSLLFNSSIGLKGYFLQTSYGKVELVAAEERQGISNDGIIEVNLSYPHPNTAGNTKDPRVSKIIKDALSVADQYIDFERYDFNYDGAVSNDELTIIAVVAGYEAAYNPLSQPSVWAHYSSLDWVGAPLMDGKIIGSMAYGGGYSMVGELHLETVGGNAHLATVGVFAHEVSHALGLPDLYDTSQQSYGVGNWSLMGYGVWNKVGSQFEGSSPALLDAWSKWYLGWVEPAPINGSQEVVINQAETTADNAFYVLAPNPHQVDWTFQQHSGEGEYFLIENRQLVGMDSGLPGCGLLVWHIYEKAKENNLANNPPTPLVYLVQADGQYHLDTKQNYGDEGDAYRSPSVFNSSSTPNSNFYNGNASNVSITDLSLCSESMTATLSYAQLNPLPVASSVSPNQVNAGGGAFTISVNGSNFVSSSIVRWNGKDLKTTYVSDTQLNAEVTADLISNTGVAFIQVYNPPPGGGISSSSLSMTIGSGLNPTPILNWLSPTQADQGGTVFTLTANGESFVANSSINWNGIPLQTRYIHDGELQAEVGAELLLQPGLVNITVSNPPPGGGISNGRTFAVTSPPRTFKISGRITNDNGMPIEGVYVSFGEGSGAASQANGVYILQNLIPGTYILKPSKSGYSFDPPQINISVVDRNIENKHFVAKKTKINIQTAEEAIISIKSEACGNQRTNCTDTNSGLAVEKPSEEHNETSSVGVAASGLMITGMVTDADNKPLANVLISTKQGFSTYSGMDGTYRLENLPSGSYDLSAKLTGYRFTQNFVNPVQLFKESTSNKDFKGFAAPKGSLTISGVVSESNGTPVSGVIVEDLEGLYRATTDAQGQYMLSGLPSGAYVLRAVKDGQYFTPAVRAVLLRENTANINFTLLSQTFIVNGTDDEEDAHIGDGICASATGVCTLRAALQESNAGQLASRIQLDSAIYGVELESPLRIANNVMIKGTGKDNTIITNKRNAALFEITPQQPYPISVTFSQMTIEKSVGPAITTQGNPAVISLDEVVITQSTDSGIFADYADVTLYRSEIINNNALEKSGALEVHGHAGFGLTSIVQSSIEGNEGSTGGVYSDGGVLIINSTISNNIGITKAGGVMLDGREGIIINSTIGENHGLEGAGIWTNAPLEIFNATIVKNQATGSGNGDYNSGFGGGIYIYPGGSKVKLQNTILSENASPTGAPNCFGTILSMGYNLLGDTTGCQFHAMDGDIVGYDPGLNGLLNNGGETLTYALQLGSYAIDTGNPSGCTDEKGLLLTMDQRGYTRPVDGLRNSKVICDIGAFELQVVEAPFQISGKIADEKGVPIEGVLVTLDNGRSVLTDKEGYYSIADLAAGSYKLSTAKDGYLFSPPDRIVKLPPSVSKIHFVGLNQ